MLSKAVTCEDVDVDGGLVAVCPDTTASVAGDVLGDCSFDDAGVGPQPTIGHEVVQDVAADGADEVDDGVGDDAGGLDELVAGGVEGDDEAAPVGVDVGPADGGVGDRDAQRLVGDAAVRASPERLRDRRPLRDVHVGEQPVPLDRDRSRQVSVRSMPFNPDTVGGHNR